MRLSSRRFLPPLEQCLFSGDMGSSSLADSSGSSDSDDDGGEGGCGRGGESSILIRPGRSSSGLKCGGSTLSRTSPAVVVDSRNSSGSSSKWAMGPSLGIAVPPGADVALFLGRFELPDLGCHSMNGVVVFHSTNFKL